MPSKITTIRLLACAAAATLTLASPALGADLTMSGDAVTLTGTDAGEHVLVNPMAGGAYFAFQPGTQVTGNCAKLNEKEYHCGGQATSLVFVLGGGNDRIVMGPSGPSVKSMRLDGGPGNDHLHATGAGVTYIGGDGDDNFAVAQSQGDVIDGGAGRDVVSYATTASTAPRSITLDGLANDGAAGEADNVPADIEVLDGGPGPDEIVGNSGPNTLYGGGGNDTLRGGPGGDHIDGNAGDDLIDEGLDSDSIGGPDTLVGDPKGWDVVSYAKRTKPLIVHIDQKANDGAAGEKDNVRSYVDELVGGQAGDTLASETVYGAKSKLDGGPGDDTLKGHQGADELYGGPGADNLDDPDHQNADLLDGGSGNDWLTVIGFGDDTLVGGGGDDVLVSKSKAKPVRPDQVRCGGGKDTVVADTKDKVSSCNGGRSRLGFAVLKGLKGFHPGYVYTGGRWVKPRG